MSATWDSEEAPEAVRLSALDWLRAMLRAIPLVVLVFGCLGILLVVRVIERPVFGQHRPLTPWITQFVCRNAFRIMGIRFHSSGALMTQRGAIVANHSSWLDIFALNARERIYFVSKAEVAGWPGIGWLARATGTVFIRRDRKEARQQAQIFKDRLEVGHKLLFFPEGTSTDGLRVLPFKSTLFAALFSNDYQDQMFVQPVAVVYRAPDGVSRRFYGWWGDMDFGSHLIKTLGAARQGGVEVLYLPPVRVLDFPDRKALSQHLESCVRDAHTASLEAGARAP